MRMNHHYESWKDWGALHPALARPGFGGFPNSARRIFVDQNKAHSYADSTEPNGDDYRQEDFPRCIFHHQESLQDAVVFVCTGNGHEDRAAYSC